MAVINASMQANPTSKVSRRRGRQCQLADEMFSLLGREDGGGKLRSPSGSALSDRNLLNLDPLGPGAKLHPILSTATFGIIHASSTWLCVHPDDLRPSLNWFLRRTRHKRTIVHIDEIHQRQHEQRNFPPH